MLHTNIVYKRKKMKMKTKQILYLPLFYSILQIIEN